MSGRVVVLIDRQVAGRYTNATLEALGHAVAHAGARLTIDEVPTRSIDASTLHGAAAIVVGPGSPYDRPDLVLQTIREAREGGLPLVGT